MIVAFRLAGGTTAIHTNVRAMAPSTNTKQAYALNVHHAERGTREIFVRDVAQVVILLGGPVPVLKKPHLRLV